MKGKAKWLCAAAALAAAAALPVRAEVGEVRIAQQYGVAYLPLMYMEHQKLLEKHAKEAGLGDVKVKWATFAAGNVMNDAPLSGTLDFASGGIAPLITLWAKTRGNLDVRGVCAMSTMPLYLNTRDASVKSIKDFTGKDRIALPAVKVSFQAVNLQMAAAKAFGKEHYAELDRLTVSLKHPDGMAALLSPASEITAHFTAPPFQYQELEHPGIHTVLDSYKIVGGPHTFTVVWATDAFRRKNPKIYRAFLAAFKEAIAEINRDKTAAAANYIKWADYKGPQDLPLKVLDDPQVKFTMTPLKVTTYADFMYGIGSIKVKPKSWKDLFFPEVHGLPGS
ncbi:MAG: ABC transporter substrate-binding protein [Betaproteobacteria bacterium]|nr:ABC transporter substrate-binding protein [Betaproteobacteria bacterium]